MKLYFVEGIRHTAIVLAQNKEEALQLADTASKGEKNPYVLYGSAGEWEASECYELSFPEGYALTQN